VIEPLDDELRDLAAALRAVDRPTAAARAATWAAIDARITPDVVPLRRPHATWALAAMAAAIVLGIGLAAATAWRGRTATHVEAVHQHDDARPALPLAPRTPVTSAPANEAPAIISSPTPLDAAPTIAAPASPAIITPPPQLDTPPIVTPSARLDAPIAPSSRARPPASARRRPAGDPSLRPEEVASFQGAQAALAAGRHQDALNALDEHGRRFPGGVFEEERQVSRAAALCKLGDEDAARDARRRFLRERPSSHLAERMRQICREID